MNHWPHFEQRYPPDSLTPAPSHQEPLIALLFILLLVGTLLWGTAKRYPKSATLATLFGSYAIIQAMVVIGLLYALSVGATQTFWQETLRGTLYGLAYFITNTLFYLGSWYVFGTEEHLQEWFAKYFTYWGFFGFTLFLPLLVFLSNSSSTLLLLLLLGAAYILFRASLLVISLNTFPRLQKYPLHIILYLCTCEIAPLLFLLA